MAEIALEIFLVKLIPGTTDQIIAGSHQVAVSGQEFSPIKPVRATPIGQNRLIGSNQLQAIIVGMPPGPGNLTISGSNRPTDDFGLT
jgi:hypothetical protein